MVYSDSVSFRGPRSIVWSEPRYTTCLRPCPVYPPERWISGNRAVNREVVRSCCIETSAQSPRLGEGSTPYSRISPCCMDGSVSLFLTFPSMDTISPLWSQPLQTNGEGDGYTGFSVQMRLFQMTDLLTHRRRGWITAKWATKA